MTRTEKLLVVAIVMILVGLLLPPTPNLPQFMLASPSREISSQDRVVVFVSDSKLDDSGRRLDLTLTVINQSGKRVYFRGQSARNGYIFPYYLKDVENDQGFGHCGNCWENYSMRSGFGTTFKSSLHLDENSGRIGFTFGYNKSGPFDQVSWSEQITFHENAR